MMQVLLITVASIITIGAIVLDHRAYGSLFRAGLILLSGVTLILYIVRSDQPTGENSSIILLTDGISNADVSIDSNAQIFSLESAENTGPGNVRWLSSVDLLQEVAEPGLVVEIYGHGTRQQIKDEFLWRDRLTQPSPGLLLGRAPQQVDAGKEFQINGRLIAESGADTVSIFRDGEQIQTILPDSSGAFSFSGRLDVEGPARYQIEAELADTLLQEPWHIRAAEPDPLSIAIVLYSPSFEMTHLAEWLGNSGHRISIRTRVGDDRFRYDDINDPNAGASELIDNLSSLDLIVLDPREVSELSDEEVQSLRSAVESGLDVIMLPPSDDSGGVWEEALASISSVAVELNAISRIDEREWVPEFFDSSDQEDRLNARLSILNFTYEGLDSTSDTLGLFDGTEPVIVRITSGRGSVSSHLFYQSYSWKLRGDQDLYASLWAGYLDRAVTLESPFVEVSSNIPRLYDRLIVTTSGTDITIRNPSQNQSRELMLVSGAEHPGVSYGYFWPRSPGWHVAESDGSSRWFYVYDSEFAWSFTEKYRRFEATRSEIKNLGSRKPDGETPTDQPMSARWWLISFLVLQGILWAERKVAG